MSPKRRRRKRVAASSSFAMKIRPRQPLAGERRFDVDVHGAGDDECHRHDIGDLVSAGRFQLLRGAPTCACLSTRGEMGLGTLTEFLSQLQKGPVRRTFDAVVLRIASRDFLDPVLPAAHIHAVTIVGRALSAGRGTLARMSIPTAPSTGGMPPLVLITGPEQILADRALSSTLEALRAVDPETEVIRLDPEGYQAGDVGHHAAPSLFGGAKCIVVNELDAAPDPMHEDVLRFVASPEQAVTMVVVHRGGQRGKKVLDALKKADARVLTAPAIKTDKDKTDFALNEFRRNGRKIAPAAVRALIEAVGRDVSELAAACAQLIADTSGVIDEQVVAKYHGGKVEATGFRVADATVTGNAPEALRLVRHAFATGLDPVPIVAVIAGQLRQLVKVQAAGRAPSGSLASSLGMAPWQIDKARRMLGGWDEEGLATSIQAIAQADFDVKGGGRDPQYAVERAILAITSARSHR